MPSGPSQHTASVAPRDRELVAGPSGRSSSKPNPVVTGPLGRPESEDGMMCELMPVTLAGAHRRKELSASAAATNIELFAHLASLVMIQEAGLPRRQGLRCQATMQMVQQVLAEAERGPPSTMR